METLPKEIIGEISSYLVLQEDFLSLMETAPFLCRFLKTFPIPYLHSIRTFNIETTAVKVSGIAGRCDYTAHGDFKQFMSERLVTFLQFHYGQRHGIYKEFYADGTLFQESHWANNTPHGPMRLYQKDGRIMAEANFENGELHGPIFLRETSSPGRPGRPVPSSPVEFEAEYVKGEIQHYRAIHTCYTSGANFQTTTGPTERIENNFRFKKGKLHGEHTLISPATRQVVQCIYREGALHGPLRVYDRKGALYYECNFQRNSQEGVTRIYYPDGTLSEEHFFVAGKATLRYKKFYPNGALYQDSDWLSNGQKIKVYYHSGNLQMDFEMQGGNLRHKIYYPHGTLAASYDNGTKSRFNPHGALEMESPDAKVLCQQSYATLRNVPQSALEFVPIVPPDPLHIIQDILENTVYEIRATIKREESAYQALNDSFCSPREIEQRGLMFVQHFAGGDVQFFDGEPDIDFNGN